MPVRSLHSAVLKWPKPEAVRAAVGRWARDLAGRDADVLRIGYFGSYATGDWGVGSDVDIVVVCRQCPRPVAERGAAFPVRGLPVPADVIVYTEDELAAAEAEGLRMAREVQENTVWVFQRQDDE